MNDLWDFVPLAGRLVITPEKSLTARITGSKRPKPSSPHSSTKLGFVNNPG
jgi:hypothetical protein